ncbi:MAG: helix-turn-helix domain-containing protein [Candidatus Promineifilaceae bacterium]
MSKSPSGNKPFGKIVASLRREKSLTQEDLSEKTSLDYDTIVNIENGRRARIESDILLNLADTFRLTSRERKEFFAAAIDISDERVVTKSKSEEILKRVLAMTEQIRLPVFVFDAYMDVVFANSVILTLLEVPENFVETADSKWSGYNVMRVVFDPKSGYKDLVGNENWDEVAISNIHLFRVATLRNQTRQRPF